MIRTGGVTSFRVGLCSPRVPLTASPKGREYSFIWIHLMNIPIRLSRILSNGAVPKDVQELLGYPHASIPMNIYAHAARETPLDKQTILNPHPKVCAIRTSKSLYDISPNAICILKRNIFSVFVCALASRLKSFSSSFVKGSNTCCLW